MKRELSFSEEELLLDECDFMRLLAGKLGRNTADITGYTLEFISLQPNQDGSFSAKYTVCVHKEE